MSGNHPPIPAAALDDRLGFVGNTGSGKTYGAGIGVESLLADRRRVVIVIFRKVVGGPGWKVLEAIKDGAVYTREGVARMTDYAAGSGNFNNILGGLRSIEAIDYPQKGQVAISGWAKEIVSW